MKPSFFPRGRHGPRLAAACLGLGLMVAGPAWSATATATFNVTATVLASCSATATDLAFGTYDPTSATDKSGLSTVSVLCSLGTPYTLSLNTGANANGATRRMASGTNRLTYQLYKDLAGSQVFGAVSDLLGISGIGTGIAVPSTVYGVIPKSQNVSPGAYADQVTVTVDY